MRTELYLERTSMNPKSQLATTLRSSLFFLVSVFTAAILGLSWTAPVQAQAPTPLKQIQTIPLPKVEGYFDHMAVDVKGQRLFVTGEHQRH
jgi:hypothetical protein